MCYLLLPILQVKELRPREAAGFAQGHRARARACQAPNPPWGLELWAYVVFLGRMSGGYEMGQKLFADGCGFFLPQGTSCPVTCGFHRTSRTSFTAAWNICLTR